MFTMTRIILKIMHELQTPRNAAEWQAVQQEMVMKKAAHLGNPIAVKETKTIANWHYTPLLLFPRFTS